MCASVGIQCIAWAFGGMIFALIYYTAGISDLEATNIKRNSLLVSGFLKLIDFGIATAINSDTTHKVSGAKFKLWKLAMDEDIQTVLQSHNFYLNENPVGGKWIFKKIKMSETDKIKKLFTFLNI